jgi:hypothetical protein
LFFAGKCSREVPESVVHVVGETVWGASVLSFFMAKFALFRQSLVDTRPPTLLAIVLRFCRCLLRPESSPLTGAWSSRARGFVTPWAALDDHVFRLCCHAWWRSGDLVFGCCMGYSSSGACGTRAVSGGAFFPTTAPVFGCFLVLDFRLCLIVYFVLGLAWSLLFSTDCL